ncbi:hypothetical protein GCM10012275_12790 [Longimycelium tulufanense]|uniref:Uncharacterized protein n=1 Tax=Longimycelium tulufanense TaxID=907463 RepID=A0A8J3C6U6_9PSEU|nr:hypothetical protein [Longimycelium tulufanense]GGM43265.1 hypothetical protein GCM10012275_12790 [Longimycelium tulufanense]
MTARAGGTRLFPVAVALFAVGLLAFVVIFGLYATGHAELPVWLNMVAGLCLPAGLALGVFALVRKGRRR